MMLLNLLKIMVEWFLGLKEKLHKNQQQEQDLKELTPKQMLRRLPIALGQVKAGNNSKNLLNEIRQIVYSLCQLKEITKKVCNNLIKSTQLCKWIVYLRTQKIVKLLNHMF